MQAQQQRSVEQHQVFVEVLNALTRAPSLQRVADASSVSYGTLWQWLYGETVHPNTRTLFAVAHTLGFRVVLERRPRNKPMLRSVK